MSLDRSAILAVSDLKNEIVDVPEWGGSVHVRTMSGSERDRFEAEHAKDPSKDFRARIVATTVCDEHGVSLFEPTDVPSLGKKSCAALDRITDVAIRLNGFSKKDQEDLAKN